MPSPTVRNNPAQRLMEREFMARLYESPLWRRNPLLTLLLGSTFHQEARTISRALRLTATETILDLACGPGIYARRFALEVSRGCVIGADLSLPMLRHGAQLLRDHCIANVRLLQGNALALPFRSSSFDVVNCAAALHLFGDLARTFAEVERVLKPGGRFIFSTFRYPRNRLMQQFLHLRYNLVGIRSFRQEDIESELRKARFGKFHYLHAKGIWVVMYATRGVA
jgi:ubiquinone/menaquinone biosynthesis C-methylase UbiE